MNPLTLFFNRGPRYYWNMNFTLTQEQYEALIALARQGTLDASGQVLPDKARALDTWLQLIEKQNGLTRSKLWVQWQEAGAAVPAGFQFPTTWPPSQRYYLELLTRPISRADIDSVLSKQAKKPVTVLVTPDPGGELGWTPVDDFFTR